MAEGWRGRVDGAEVSRGRAEGQGGAVGFGVDGVERSEEEEAEAEETELCSLD